MRTTDAAPLYEDDFFAWTQLQARGRARQRPSEPLDLAHLALEIRDLGKEQGNALWSWTARILEHLLLLAHSPAEDPRRGWTREVLGFHREIAERTRPTLRRDLDRHLPRLYRQVRRDLVTDMAAYSAGVTAARLPERCPWFPDQVLGDFWPERAAG